MARIDVRAPQVLVALATVIAVECVRVVFTVAFNASERLGNVPAGLIVLCVLVAPVVMAPLARLLPLRALVVAVAVLAVAARLAVQLVGAVSFPLAGVATFLTLSLLVLAIVVVRRGPGKSTASVVAVIAGLALDLLLRSVGTTWDLPWRDDPWGWAGTATVLVGVVAAMLVTVRSDDLDDGGPGGGRLVPFLLWPFLYLTLVYAGSPAFLGSSGSIGYPVALFAAFLGIAAGVVGVVVGARVLLPRPAVAGAALAVGGLAWVLAGGHGAVVVVAAPLVSGLAGLILGHASDAVGGADRSGVAGTAVGFGLGGLWVGAAILAFAVHTLQPLPVSNRWIPVLVGLSMSLAVVVGRQRAPTLAFPAAQARWLVGAIAVAAVVVPVVTLVAWPADRPARTDGTVLRVMTFNVDQGVTPGRLDLEQLARDVQAEDPDVVVLEEVGRGWALSGTTDEAVWFSRRLRMPFVWSPAADDQFGNVVLSRVPMTSSEVLQLGKGNGTQARSAAFVHLDVAGRDVLVIGTHLMNGSSEPMHVSRSEAYRSILERWDAMADTVFLGDMNTYPRLVPPGWPELAVPLYAGFATTQDTELCTMPTSNRNCPDWIFAGPGVVESPVWLGVDRPDHRPVVAEVTFAR